MSLIDSFLQPQNFGSIPQGAGPLLTALQSQQNKSPTAQLNRTGYTMQGYVPPGQVAPTMNSGQIGGIINSAANQPLMNPWTGQAQNSLLQGLQKSANPGVISQFSGQFNPFSSSQGQSALQQLLGARSGALNQAQSALGGVANLHGSDINTILGNTAFDQNFAGNISTDAAMQSVSNRPDPSNIGTIAAQAAGPLISMMTGSPIGFLMSAYKQQQAAQKKTQIQNALMNALSQRSRMQRPQAPAGPMPGNMMKAL